MTISQEQIDSLLMMMMRDDSMGYCHQTHDTDKDRVDRFHIAKIEKESWIK